MYSPKIHERFIPALYRLARDRGQPMTRLVADAVERLLASEGVVLDEPEPKTRKPRRRRPPPGLYERAACVPSATAASHSAHSEQRALGDGPVCAPDAARGAPTPQPAEFGCLPDLEQERGAP